MAKGFKTGGRKKGTPNKYNVDCGQWRNNHAAVKYQSAHGECVYLIDALGSGRYKIGVTANLEQRLIGMRTQCPFPVFVRTLIPGGVDFEKFLHGRYRARRVNGEWFELPFREVGYICALGFIPGIDGAADLIEEKSNDQLVMDYA